MRQRISVFGCVVITLCVVLPGCNSGNGPQDGAKTTGEKQPSKSTASSKPKPSELQSSGSKSAAKPTKATNQDDVPEEHRTPADGAKVVIEKEVPRGDGLLTPDPLDAEAPPVVPTVEMTEQHAATCLVKVGDTLPAAQLTDLGGKPQDVNKLLGDKLTVVVFFRGGQDEAVTELSDLAVGVASPLASRGVKVIGVCEQGAADAAKATCEKAGVSYPVLLDTDGAYFARLATGKMPRTYLVDDTGKIIWFDIDYTLGSRHDLREALRALVVK